MFSVVVQEDGVCIGIHTRRRVSRFVPCLDATWRKYGQTERSAVLGETLIIDSGA